MGRSLWDGWDSARALNGFLAALFLPVPFVLLAPGLVAPAARSFLGVPLNVLGPTLAPHVGYFVLALASLYVPMWVLARLQNGWLNDLYWTIVPLLMLWYYALVALQAGPVQAFRAGMLTMVMVAWALRLTHNYLRREEYTWGAQEDFRFQRMAVQYGRHWWWVSFFAQFLSQHVTETLLGVPYLWILRDASPAPDARDVLCAALAVMCLVAAHVADGQLREFVTTNKNPAACLSDGLWAYSRNPNYVAESTFHWAVALWSLRVASPWVLLCPAFNSLVLVISARLKVWKRNAVGRARACADPHATQEAHMRSGPRAKAFAAYCERTRMIF